MDIRKIYGYALQREIEGKRFFETDAARLSHATAVAALNRLAGEEQKHIEYVQAQINALEAGKTADVAFGLELDKSGVFSQRPQPSLSIKPSWKPWCPICRSCAWRI